MSQPDRIDFTIGSLQIAESENEGDRQPVLDWLREYNHDHNGSFMQALSAGAEQPLVLLAKHDGELVGGLIGSTIFQWLKVDLMAVHPQRRRVGVGRQLISRAESIAMQRGCKFVYVDTMSYQAPRFYQSIGFREVGRLADWDSHGHDKVFFRKDL